MKKILLSLLVINMIALSALGQSVVFTENFDPPLGADSVTAFAAVTPNWAVNTTLFKTGTQSFHKTLAVNDSATVVTNAFSTVGFSNVMLSFSHICKLHYLDKAEIFVSNNNGASWIKLTSAQYLGSGGFATYNNVFCAVTYGDWQPGNDAAIPTNAWWKDEIFDISAFVASSSQVRIKFQMLDAGGQGANGNFGWLLDNVRVTCAISELNPPVITLSAPVIPDTVFTTGPFVINADIVDASGIDTAWLIYTVNSGTPDTLGMVNTTGNIYSATIPSHTYNTEICYRVVAIDATVSQNTAVFPASGCKMLKILLGPSVVTIGTGTLTNANTGYPAPYGNWYHGARHQFLIPASELMAAGLSPGPINSLAFDVATVQGTPLQGFLIKMGHTTLNALTTAFLPSLTTVYSVTSYTETLGWNTHTFQTPFIWNGTDNLVIETCFNNTAYTYNAVVRQTATTYSSSLYYNADAQGVCSMSSGTVASQRPNMQLASPVTNYTYDAGIHQVTSPSGIVMANTGLNVTVSVRNFGTDTLKKAVIRYSVDGVIQPTIYNWTGSLLQGVSSAPITVDTVSVGVGSHFIKAWTSLPNDSIDQNNNNDTAITAIFACAQILNGTYTVGGTGADFANLNDALSALNNCGINGPVVFNFTANSGPYTGGIEIGQINGATAVNTITFNGNGNIINQGVANYMLAFNGTRYFTLNNFKLINTTPATPIFGIMLRNQARFVNITNNLIDVGTTSTSTLTTGISISGSTTSGTLTGNNAQYVTITGNEIIGGYYGVTLVGASSYLNCYGNVVSDNIIRDFYLYGIYLSNVDTAQITDNNINRATRATLSTFYGIYMATSRNIKIHRNRIHSSGTGSYGAYPVYITTSFNNVGYETEIVNNAIYNIPTTSTIYGIYVLGTNNAIHFYYNTINLNYTGTGTVRALFFSTTPNNYRLFNNIISISGSGGGTKHLVYVTTGSSSFASNYNNFHMGSVAGTNYVGYYSTSHTSFANWQTGTLLDSNSLNLAPPFMSPTDFRLSNTLLSAKALPMPGITVDIHGMPRGPYPTIGAHEVPLIPKDAGVIQILNPTALSTIGEAASVQPHVRIQNFGTDTLYNIPVNYVVNNGTPVTASYAGPLYPFQTDTMSLPSYISPAGNTTLCAFTSVLNDTNTFNDSSCVTYYATPLFDAQMTRVKPIPGGCGKGLDTVRVVVTNVGTSAITGNYTMAYRVQGGTNIASNTINTAIPIGDSLQYTFPQLVDLTTLVDSVFTIEAWVKVTGDNVLYNDTNTTKVNSLKIPLPPVIGDTTIPYGNYVTLFAQSPDSVLWFEFDTSSVPFWGGNYLTTPILFDTAVYWVQAISGMMTAGGPQGVNIAPLAVANASTCNTGACSTFNDLNFGTCGTQLVWITTGTPPDPTPHVNFIDFTWPSAYTMDKIKIHHAETTSRFLSGASIYTWDGANWVYHSNFSNLPMQCENEVSFPAVTTTRLRLTSFLMSGSQLSNPNFREIEVFSAAPTIPACSSIRIPVTVNVMGIPPYDLGVSELHVKEGCALAQEPVTIKVYNQGTDTMQGGGYASFRIDNNPWIANETITATIAPGDTVSYTFTATANLYTSVDTFFRITARVGHLLDPNHQNDTLVRDSVVSMFAPPPPTFTSPVTTPYATYVTLNAVSPDTIIWYTADTATVELARGPSYTTPVLYDTTTYWLASTTISGGSGLFELGTGTTMNTNTTYPAPYGNWYWGAKHQFLIRASELNALGLTAGNISSVAFNVATIQGVALQGFEIKMGHTTQNQVTTSFQTTGLSTVYSVASYTETAGWNTHNFQTPFAWDGVSNVIVETCFNNSSYTNNAIVYQTTTSFPSTVYYNSDATGICAITTGTTVSQRPNMRFFASTLTQGCISNKVPFVVNVMGIPPFDLGIKEIVVAEGCALGQEPVGIRVYNQGTDTMYGGATASYRVNNNPWVTTETIPNTIAPGDTVLYTFTALANLSAPVDTMFTIRAWVNHLLDPNHQNDTLQRDSIVSLFTPQPPTVVTPVNITYGSKATLSASGAGTISWFATDTSTVALDTGNTFTSPYLYGPTTYWAAAGAGSFSTGSLTTNYNGTTNCGGGFMIDVQAFKPNMKITGFDLRCFNTGTQTVTVFYKLGTYNGFGGTPAAWTQVGVYSVNSTNTAGATYLPLPASNHISLQMGQIYGIYLQYHSQYGSIASVIQNSDMSITSGLGHCTNWDACCTPREFNGGIHYQIGAIGCSSTKVPVQVFTSPPPLNDAGVMAVVNPGASTLSGVPTPIQVTVKNYGANNLTSAVINYRINGVLKTPFNLTSINLPKDSITGPITIGTETFAGGVYLLEAWTSLPNNVLDSVNSNDSIFHTFNACLSGTYTLGKPTSNFPSFAAAINALTTAGLCGHVVFLVDSGTYSTQLTLTAIPGMGPNATVTFKGATGDSTHVVLEYSPMGATDYWAVRFDGATDFIFSNMTIRANGATYGRTLEFMNGAQRITISNCIIETSKTSTSSLYVPIYSTSTGTSNNISFLNNRISGGYYGIYWYGTSALKKNVLRMVGNVIEDYWYYGIYTYYADSLIIESNRVTNRPGAGVLYPVYLGYTNGYGTFSKNRVYSNGTSTNYGVYVAYKQATSTVPLLVSNNMISQTGNTAGTVYGIYTLGSNHVNFYNNSVWVSGGSATSGYAFYQSSGAGINVVNNIFRNSGGGYSYYVATPTAIGVSNFNNFSTTGTNLAYWSSVQTSLAALKVASGKDANSISVDPGFVSLTNLYPSAVSLYQGGITLPGITHDIFGTLRPSTQPCIGAVEFVPPANDAGLVAITAPNSPVTGGSAAVVVTIRNGGLNTLTSTLINWQVNGVTQPPYNWSGNLATNATAANISIGTFLFVSGSYDIKVWVSLPNNQPDAFAFNDTLVKNVIACATPMSGVYTVGGTGASFSNFTAAVSALKFCGISDSVLFLVNNGVYNEQIDITQITGANSNKQITFRSQSGDSSAVVLQFASTITTNNYVVYLNGGKYINFERITLRSTGAGMGRTVVLQNGANFNRFEGCVIETSVSTSTSHAGVYTASTSADQHNIFRGNRVLNGYYGFYVYGSSTNRKKGFVIENNNISGYYYYGIQAYYTDSIHIGGNTMTNGSNSAICYHVQSYYNQGYGKITANKIHATNTSTVYGISVGYGTLQPIEISNNFVMQTVGATTVYGIYLLGSGQQANVYHNSVNVTSNSTAARCLFLSSGMGNRVVNNSFANVGGGGHASYISLLSYVVESNHNNYYTTGTNFVYLGSAHSTLASLVASTMMDSNSVSADPMYFSSTDLHSLSPVLYAGGKPLTSVPIDIDGQVRSTFAPCIGADEFAILNKDVAPFMILSPAASYSNVGASATIQVRLRNMGSDTITSIPVSYRYAGQAPVNATWSGSLLSGQTTDFTFGTPITVLTGQQPIVVYTSLPGDLVQTNDTMVKLFTGIPVMQLAYSDNFEGPQNIWASEGSSSGWQRGVPAGPIINNAFSPPNAWVTNLTGQYGISVNEFLYTPYFNFSSVTGAVMKFRQWRAFADNNDGGQVQVSTDGGTTWGSIGYMNDPAGTNWYNHNAAGLHYFTGNTSGWIQSTYDLSNYDNAATPVMFRFRLFSNASGSSDGWAIDNFEITVPQIATDGGVIRILSPIDSTIIQTQQQVEVRIQNFGSQALTSVPVKYRVNNQPVVSALWTGTLTPGDSVAYTFTTTFVAPSSNYTLKAWTDISGDLYQTNDTTIKTIKAIQAPVDAGVYRMVSPSDTTYVNYNPHTASFMVRNYGTAALTSMQMELKVGLNVMATENWSGTLAPGDSMLYTFTYRYNSPMGFYTLCAKAIAAGDGDPTNDSYCKQLLGTVGMDDLAGNPVQLLQNRPNPATNSTTVEFSVPRPGKVIFEMHNLLGQPVYREERVVNAGRNTIELSLDGIPAGVYSYGIRFEDYQATKQMIVVK